jgi:hypothetical protein
VPLDKSLGRPGVRYFNNPHWLQLSPLRT